MDIRPMPIESEWLQALFEAIPFGIYVVDVETYDLVFINRFLRERGFVMAPDGKCWSAIYSQEGPCSFCRNAELIDENGRPNGRVLISQQFNEVDDHWYQLQERAISWPDGRTVKYSIAVDISELKEVQNSLAEAHALLAIKNRELEKASVTDPLTGLANRLETDRILNRELERAHRYSSPFSVALLDLDHFKAINDAHGHQAGDKVLVETARMLSKGTRATDTVGRWGGEEFIIISPETNLGAMAALVEKLRQALTGHPFPEVGPWSASFGVSTFQPGDTESSIVARADAALYRAKAAGRNRVELETDTSPSVQD